MDAIEAILTRKSVRKFTSQPIEPEKLHLLLEAAMSAPHFKLGNLIGIVDRNRFMIDGETEDVMPLEPFADKWRAFGWDVVEVDGHDFDQLDEALSKAWAATEDGVKICVADA